MDIETYLNSDTNHRLVNRSFNCNLMNSRNQSELIRVRKRGNYLLRQELNNYTPECTIKTIIIYHLIFGLLCLVFSIPMLLPHTDSLLEIQYDQCNPKTENMTTDDGYAVKTSYCESTIKLNKTMKSPLFVYYKLDNFYTNHREYVKSKIYQQLQGEAVSKASYDSYCSKMKTNKDLFGSDTRLLISINHKALNPDDYLYPCGLIAASIFNDTFTLKTKDNEPIAIDENGIAYYSDKKYMFKNSQGDTGRDKQWLNVEDEHFMVWMSMELLPYFMKKWGHIDHDLQEGEYTLRINTNWQSSTYDTKKYFVIAEGVVMGNNPLFGYILLVGFCLSGIMIGMMGTVGCMKTKKFNPLGMSWD